MDSSGYQQQAARGQAAAATCLDVVFGVSPLLGLHKLEVAGLLQMRGPGAFAALERLVADLTEVLAVATDSISDAGLAQQQPQLEGRQQQEAVVDGGPPVAAASACPDSRTKRIKGHESGQALKEQPVARAAAQAPTARDALALADVVEDIMSFAKPREVMGRLSRVSRAWRRAAASERLCQPVLEQRMPSALLGGEESLYARLGHSAKRCLLVDDAARSADVPHTQGQRPACPVRDLSQEHAAARASRADWFR